MIPKKIFLIMFSFRLEKNELTCGNFWDFSSQQTEKDFFFDVKKAT